MTNGNTDREADSSKTLGVHKSPGTLRRFRRWTVSGLLVLAIAVVLLQWGTDDGSNKPEYKTQTIQRGNLTVLVTATGNLEPTNEVEVGSELSGIVESVQVDYNDRVKVGQVLATLDTSKLKAQVLQSKAELESARASVLQAQATVKETRNELSRLRQLRKLSNSKAVSQHDLDAAQAELERALADEASAKAAVSKALATLDYDETNLSKAVIRSPINGIVLERSVEPGQTVAASMETPVLFTLAEDPTKMELHVNVDEADVGQVKEGQQATFTVDAYPDLVFPARIIQVRYGYVEEDGVITYETVLNVDNPDLSLRPGMTGTADIVVKRIDDAVLVSNAALRFAPPQEAGPAESGNGSILNSILPHPPTPAAKTNGDATQTGKKQHVWTLRDRQLAAIPVTIGDTDGSMTVATEGSIEPGTVVVVEAVSRAR